MRIFLRKSRRREDGFKLLKSRPLMSCSGHWLMALSSLSQEGRTVRVPAHAWLAQGASRAFLFDTVDWLEDSVRFTGRPLLSEVALNEWLTGEASQSTPRAS